MVQRLQNTQPRKMWQQWERLILIEDYSRISQGLDWLMQQEIVWYNVAGPYGKASYRLLNTGPGLHGPMTRLGEWHVRVASPGRSIYIPWQKAVLSIRVHGLAVRGSGG